MYHNNMRNNAFDLQVTASNNSRNVSRCYRPMGASSQVWKYVSCYTAVVAYLSAGDVVRVRNMYRGSLVSTKPQHTFIGFIKLSHSR